jgi:hypothetical protein
VSDWASVDLLLDTDPGATRKERLSTTKYKELGFKKTNPKHFLFFFLALLQS